MKALALVRSEKAITTLMQVNNSIVVSIQGGYLSSFHQNQVSEKLH